MIALFLGPQLRRPAQAPGTGGPHGPPPGPPDSSGGVGMSGSAGREFWIKQDTGMNTAGSPQGTGGQGISPFLESDAGSFVNPHLIRTH